MEDYSPSPEEVEDTPLKKRRFLSGNFLRSWLEHRRQDEDEEESKKTEKKDSKGGNWRPERLRDKLRGIFRNIVGLELVPLAMTASEPQLMAKKVHHELDFPSYDKDDEEEGLLAVSPDAQLRYYGYELMDEPDLDQEEPEIEVVDTETDDPFEKLGPLASETQSSSEQTIKSAEPVGEVLRRRQADRLEEKIKKLKKQTNSIKSEQDEIIERQKDFADQMAERQEAQERFETVTVPNMEKARQRLQQRLEQPQPVKLETKAVITEAAPSRQLELKTELNPEVTAATRFESNIEAKALKELAKPEHSIKPEELLHNVELAAEHNVPIESLYERRHEAKDTPDSSMSTGATSSPGLSTPNSRSVLDYPPPLPTLTPHYPPTAKNSNLTRLIAPQADASMYTQAAQTGFWSGICLLIITLLAWIFMR